LLLSNLVLQSPARVSTPYVLLLPPWAR
jgi:hypothetical protein